MFVLRYVASKDGGFAPTAEVRAVSDSDQSLEIISPPGVRTGHLAKPGACAVIRAERSGELVIGIRRSAASGSLDASFRLELLSSAEERSWQDGSDKLPVRPSPTLGASRSGGLRFLAHLAMRGDVEIDEGDWAAGPMSPTPIEGLQIHPGLASDPRMEIQVMHGGRPQQWSRWFSVGEFAGSRGRRAPLLGVRIRIAGSEQAELQGEALFLGSLVVSKRGRELEFVSAAGVDPLVGLRLALRGAEVGGASKAFVAPARERESRVRVFRASVGT